MKNFVFAAILVVLLTAVFTAMATTVKTGTHNDRLMIYYHWQPADANDDFNDVNTLVYPGFYGDVSSIIIDANGTITNFGISIMIDPPEFGQEQSDKLYALATYTIADANSVMYPVIVPADDPNFAAGNITLVGDLYLGRLNVDPNINDLKIFLNCRLK